MGQSVSLLFGVGTVFLGSKVAEKVWDKRTGKKAGWMLALFPSLILYSCLILREVYVYFFLSVALYGIVDWTATKNIKSFILALIGFISATFFHSAMIVGLFVFLTIVFLQNIKVIFKNLKKFKVFKKLNIFTFFIIIIISVVFIKDLRFEKIPNIFNSPNENLKFILIKIKNFDKGSAKYPRWLVPETTNEIIYKSPFRIVYFVFAPFPWDIKKFSHLIGMFDALIYIFLSYLIWRNKKVILSDPTLKIILILLLAYLVVYGIGVGNFGTGIRHRSKFAIIFIILAAPLLPKIILNIKNKLHN